MQKKKLVIVGAGISGLSLAYFARKIGLEVEIFESSGEAGGLIQTKTTPYGIAETAANAILDNSLFREISTEIGVELCKTFPIAKKRFIFRNGLRKWPLTWIESLLLPWRFIFGILSRGFKIKPKKMETVTDWCRSLFGKAFLENILAPALQGIYAGNTNELSASLLFYSFASAKNEKEKDYKGSISVLEGMGFWLKKLALYLEKSGVVIHYGKRFDLKDQQGKQDEDVIYCIAASLGAARSIVLDSLGNDFSEEEKDLWNSLDVFPAISVTVFYPQMAPILAGFGCLFPAQAQFSSLGVVASSAIFPARSLPEYFSETWIFSGRQAREWLEKEDQAIREAIITDRKKIFPFSNIEPTAIEIARWPEAIPNYNLKLEKFLSSGIVEKLRRKNVYLHGNYMGRLGLAGMLRRSKAMAAAIGAE